MTMSIRTNVGSLNAQRNLVGTQNLLSTTLSKLSSGYRISKAGDDAAGLAISETLRSQISGMNQAARNANDAISMIQTAEGGMQEVHTMLQRMSQLAVQAANGTLSDSNRANINIELQDLMAEINGIAKRTNFNGMSLLNGSFAASLDTANSDIALGDALADTTISNIDVSRATAGTYTFSANGDEVTLSDGVNSQTITLSDVAANGSGRINFDRFGVSIDLVSAAGDAAADIAAALNGMELAVTGNAARFQIGDQAIDTIEVTFASIMIDSNNSNTAFAELAAALAAFDGAKTVENANNLLAKAKVAIDAVSSMRADLGAKQNRLEHTIANLNITAENLSASESRIRDADIAEETAAMSRAQILMQAGVSVLAQANQMPQLALKLLG
mgnify:CR=1 FL=1